jgi:hypothetical protein
MRIPMAYSISAADMARSVSDAVRKLRKALGEQQFAYRMKTAIRTIARYETVRPPKGRVLRQLETIAAENNLPHLAEVFHGALDQELGVPNAEKIRIDTLARLHDSDRMRYLFDTYVKLVNADGSTVNAVQLEFYASDGRTYVADIAPPESQRVTGPDGKKVTKKVPRNPVGPHFSIIESGAEER